MPITQILGSPQLSDGTTIPLSGAIQAGDFLFLSGQLAMNADHQIEGDDIEEQTERTLQNIDASLEKAGYTKANIVKATVWLKSTADFMGFNRAYADYFGNQAPPARSTVCTDLMNPKALVEIEVLAFIGD